MRIGLIGDTHGDMPALGRQYAAAGMPASIKSCTAATFSLPPFSPDPPDETIAFLRAENITAISGNGEISFSHWNTPMWEAALAQRMRRPDSPAHFLPQVAAGQAALSSDSLAAMIHSTRLYSNQVKSSASSPGQTWPKPISSCAAYPPSACPAYGAAQRPSGAGSAWRRLDAWRRRQE